MPGTCTAPAVSRPPGVSPLLPTSPYSWPRSNPIAEVTAPPQLLCKLERGEKSVLPLLTACFLGGRAFGPPLCRGSAPATPPSKTIAHQRYAFFQPVRLHQRAGCQPTAQSDSLNGGDDERLVRTRTVYDLKDTLYPSSEACLTNEPVIGKQEFLNWPIRARQPLLESTRLA